MDKLTQPELRNNSVDNNGNYYAESEQAEDLADYSGGLEAVFSASTSPNSPSFANLAGQEGSPAKTTGSSIISRLRSGNLTPKKILSLQRSIGNRAVSRVLASSIAQRQLKHSARQVVQRVSGASSNKFYSTAHKTGSSSSSQKYNKPASLGIARAVSPNVIQRQSHLTVGTMLHHAPDASIGNTKIDDTNDGFYRDNEVISSHRGELLNDQVAGGEFDWKGEFDTLATKIAGMRAKTGLTPGQFPIIINANWMISPGYQKKPKEYMDQEKAVMAVSSVWGFQYQTPPAAPAPKSTTSSTSKKAKSSKDVQEDMEKDHSEGGAISYAAALDAWKAARDSALSGRRDTVKLGENAKKLLRSKAKKKVTPGTRNEVIPHRGLRNYLFTQEGYTLEFVSKFKDETDFVHIITLDSDTQFEDGEVLKEIGVAAETKMKNGLMITATDYIYERDNLFAWFAGALDKVARHKLEKGEQTFDAYPAEPGLTISFDMKNWDAAAKFLADSPFGKEDSVKPTESEVFKELVNSGQSVEGKNLRAKWRNYMKDPSLHINRTVGNLSVTESDEQARLQVKTLKSIELGVLKTGQVEPGLIKTLISGDNYHSLTKDRNHSDNSQAKLKSQMQILEESTNILNEALKTADETRLTKIVKEPNSDACKNIKALVKAGLQKYLKGE